MVTANITNPRTYWTNKGKSSLTSLVACFILGKVCCRTCWGGYACGLKINKLCEANLTFYIYICKADLTKI